MAFEKVRLLWSSTVQKLKPDSVIQPAHRSYDGPDPRTNDAGAGQLG